MSRVVAGIGCRRDCAAADIEAAIALAAASHVVTELAAPSFKAHEPGLREAAGRLGLVLTLVEPDALQAAQSRCVTVSEAAHRATGVGSVAEGCALAACGPDARLVHARVQQGGATCALAEPA